MTWQSVLGVAPSDTHRNARAKYLALALRRHPNKGGTTAAFQELQRAWSNAQAHFKPGPAASSPRGQRATGPPRAQAKGPPRAQAKSRSQANGASRSPPAPKRNLASAFLEGMLRSGGLVGAYNSMRNANLPALKSAFEAWADRAKLTRGARQALFQAVNVKSKDEFVAQMSAVTSRLKKQPFMRTRVPFAMILEVTYDGEAAGRQQPFSAGSSARLAGPVLQALRRMPDVIVPVIGGTLHKARVYEALRRGIKDFVHVDDAMFTGYQKFTIARDLATEVNEYYEDLNDRVDLRSTVTLWLSTAFATDVAVRRVRTAPKFADTRYNSYDEAVDVLKVDVFAPGKVVRPRIPLRVRFEEWRRLQGQNRRRGAAMTVLAHRVPNRWSFGASLAAALGAVMEQTAWRGVPYRVAP